ncbi:peroxiredoxin family protein [Thermoflexus hugenholtzii]
MTALQIGDPAPLIFGTTLNGEPYLEDPQGVRHILLLAFFKESCAASRRILPALERLHQAYRTDHWRLLGIGQDPPEALQEIARKFQISFPLIADRDFQTSRAYRLTHVPTLFLIAPSGRIQRILIGFHREELEDLSRALARSLGQEPQSITRTEDPPLQPA